MAKKQLSAKQKAALKKGREKLARERGTMGAIAYMHASTPRKKAKPHSFAGAAAAISKRKKPRTAAQKAATKRMLAANKKKSKKKATKKKSTKRKVTKRKVTKRKVTKRRVTKRKVAKKKVKKRNRVQACRTLLYKTRKRKKSQIKRGVRTKVMSDAEQKKLLAAALRGK